MRKTVTAELMLEFLTDEWKKTHHLMEKLGLDDERCVTHCDMCIGMKELVEAMICEPVNLRMDGTVTLGLD